MESKPSEDAVMMEEPDVDSLLRHIALSQQRAQERRRVLREVQLEAAVYHQKIMEVKEKLEEAGSSLEARVDSLAERQFERDLLRRRQGSLETQRAGLLTERLQLRARLEKMNRETVEEEEKFMKEVENFNVNYGLMSNREELLSAQAEAEARTLDQEADLLRKEISSLKSENFQLIAHQVQKKEREADLRRLQQALRDLDEKIRDSITTTQNLEEEKFSISHKPQTDAECLRLKKELDAHKDADLREAYEGLCMEIDFLQRKTLEPSAERSPLS